MDSSQFPKWLVQQIRRREWTQSEFARRAGLAQSTVSSWATGDRLPDPSSCDLIADVLGVDRDLVLALAGHRAPDVELDPGDPRHELLALVRRISWTPERVAAMRGILTVYLDMDRTSPAERSKS